MSNSIFDIEVRIDVDKEFQKMVNYLHCTSSTTRVRGHRTDFISAIDAYAFKRWKYRGTAIDCKEYLENIGVEDYYFNLGSHIDIKLFLYYIEFIYNIYKFAITHKYIEIISEDVKAIINNISLIVEKMNLKFIQQGDKYILVKRDSDIDSVIELVDADIALVLLEYRDIKITEDIRKKQEILKTIDKYIEKRASVYSKTDKDTYSSIGYIMNNFGINHKINKKYENLSAEEMLKWYDKCFLLAIHLIRKKEIDLINDERKSLDKD